MEQNYEELKIKIGKNIAEYRKLSGMSQIDFAESLNYSDKAVSKWERGESLPDIIVLKQIADSFGITVNDLLGEKDTKKKKLDIKKLLRNKLFVLILSLGVVWLVATIVCVVMLLFSAPQKLVWISFIYALPICSIISIVFTCIWRHRLWLFVSESLLVWTLVLSICLSVNYSAIWYMFIIAIPLQMLITIWNLMKWKKKK